MEDVQGQKAASETAPKDFREIKESLTNEDFARANKLAEMSQSSGAVGGEEKQFADLAAATDRIREKSGNAEGRPGGTRSFVRYRLTAEDAQAVNRRRDNSNANREQHVAVANGTTIHVGNRVAEGDEFPMVIVREWETVRKVNGQVFLDGNDTLWVVSVGYGDEPGQFHG